MFRWIDLYLIDKIFDPLALKIHKRWNTLCYTLSKWFFTLGSITLLYATYEMFSFQYKNWILPAIGCWVVLITLFDIMTAFRLADKLEVRYTQASVDTLPPNLRDGVGVHIFNRRFYLLLLFATLFIEVPTVVANPAHLVVDHTKFHNALISSLPLILIGYYFLACTPRLRRPKTEEKKAGKTDIVPAPQGA